MNSDWFRSTTWDDSVALAFDEKLRRARRKAQYLRIQACTLARSHPEVALKLLDRYFELGDDFDHAQAHVDRASALLSLDRVAEALDAYEAALAREAEYPRLKTQAYIYLPFVIARRGLRDYYPRALDVLALHRSRLTFPVDHFRWHASRALIASDLGDHLESREHAQRAMEFAEASHSGFRYHPAVGLVSSDCYGLIRELRARCLGEWQS